MASLSQSRLHDSVRCTTVKKRPEETIRQALLGKLVGELSYPAPLIAVEKELATLPHLNRSRKVPQRRFDIVVFALGIHPQHELYPLLLIECKADKISEETAAQALSYNSLVKAPFVALAGAEEVLWGRFDAVARRFVFEKGLPSYPTLLSWVRL